MDNYSHKTRLSVLIGESGYLLYIANARHSMAQCKQMWAHF